MCIPVIILYNHNLNTGLKMDWEFENPIVLVPVLFLLMKPIWIDFAWRRWILKNSVSHFEKENSFACDLQWNNVQCETPRSMHSLQLDSNNVWKMPFNRIIILLLCFVSLIWCIPYNVLKCIEILRWNCFFFLLPNHMMWVWKQLGTM